MTEKNRDYDVAVLLPTRGRTGTLKRSVISLINRAVKPSSIIILFAFDKDDEVGPKYFTDEIAPELEKRNIDYEAVEFEPLGYVRLNEYANELVKFADAHWYMVWNDDAVMDSAGWDREIAKRNGEFKLLGVHTHRDHPYSIFPIVPAEWVEVLGHISPHQLSDGWTSQVAYMIDIVERINVHVTHDRFDLTGNNEDETFKKRIMLEGNIEDPRDFHHLTWNAKRVRDCEKLVKYMKDVRGMDVSFWEKVKIGIQDPWEKLKIADINGQMRQFHVKVSVPLSTL
jgi:hypothetical protein